MEVLTVRILYRFGKMGCFLPAVIFHLIAAAYPASALDSASSFVDYASTTWTHRDGLRSTFIRAIAQTADGYIWLGTTDGLFRFDGARFVQWRKELAPNGLGVVNVLRAARDGGLLVGTEAGIVARLRGDILVSISAAAPVQSVLEDRDGTVWVAAGNRLLQYPSDLPSAPPAEASLPSNWISGPFQDQGGSIWVSTEDGVQRLEQNRLTKVLTGRLWLSQDANGAIWGTRADGMNEPIDAQSNLHSALGNLNIHTILHDSRGTTWIGTFGAGLLRVGPANGKLEHWTQSAGLADDSVSALFEDREHNLWIGTHNGLQRLHDSKIKTLTGRDGLLSGEVNALSSAPGGAVWAATTRGVNRVDPGHRELHWKGANVTAIASDRQGRLWAGTATGVVRLIDGTPESVALSAKLTHITAIAIDSGDHVWLCDAARGLFRWSNGRTDDFSREPLLQGRSILSAASDSRGRVWFGLSTGGIVVFESGAFHAFSAHDGLPESPVSSIAVDDDGTIWIGTDAGLSRFNGSKFVTWTTADGLPGERVLWVLSDQHGSLWVGYSFGIASIKRTALEASARNRSTHIEFDLFDSGDGLNGNPSRTGQMPAVQTADGTIWFQTSDGVGIIDPRRLLKNPVIPPVQIEGMTADGSPMEVAHRIRVQPRTRDVEFDYTALSFVEPRRVQFRYMLEGYDSAWHEAGTRRQAFYTNLPPRRYRFHVVACNNDGIWNEAGAALQFDLLPAFYQTLWFAILCGIMLLMVGLGAYRWRVLLLAARLRARFEERLAERTRIAQELHDNLLQSVLGISLQLEVTDELLPHDSAGRKPLEQALRLSKSAMTEGRRALNDLRTHQIGADDLVRAFSQVAQDFPAPAAPKVDILTEGQERPLHPVAGQDVLQIGRQAIANALQHANARRLHVLLSYGRRGLSIRVKDNGRGIDEKTLNLGKAGHHGIAGMRERAGRIGASLSILSRVGEGTEVCLDVPEHLICDSPADSQSGDGKRGAD